MGATLHRCARASHYRGLSYCGAQAPDAQAQQLWPTGPAAPRHVGSSQTRARTRVPCIGRQTLNHCATWEAKTVDFCIAVKILTNGEFPGSPVVRTPHAFTAEVVRHGQKKKKKKKKILTNVLSFFKKLIYFWLHWVFVAARSFL